VLTRWLPLATLVLFHCARPVYVPYTPLEQKTEFDQEKLYAAAEGALLEKGYLFQERDPDKHRLRTKPRMLTGGEGEPRFKYVWLVDTGGGTLRIELRCQEGQPGAEPVSCGKETPEKIVKEQRAIADKALAEARGD